MIWINFRVLNKFGHKKLLSASMIIGLGLISVGTFFDMISNLINMNLGTLIPTCFTLGAIIFVVSIMLWSKYMVEIMTALNEYAHNDSMTGLYNRMGFEKVFEKKIAIQESFYIMVFDLDKTKIINDNFGHLKGDKYIISAARIIKDEIGENGFIGRTGGDEFVALVENITEEKIEDIKFFIKNRVSHIFNKQNTQISIGYSKYKKDGETFEELLNLADKKMYEDKKKIKEISLEDRQIII
jgi:diguanylate cyclase (GGDEF)-like protein